jgi:hypothetical protein
MLLGSQLGYSNTHLYIPTTMNIYGDAATEDMRGANSKAVHWYYELCKTSEEM